MWFVITLTFFGLVGAVASSVFIKIDLKFLYVIMGELRQYFSLNHL